MSAPRRPKDLLQMCEIPRDSATIGFLLNGGRPAEFDIDAELVDLEERGWLARDGRTREWNLTAEGRAALDEFENWEFVVEDVFKLSSRDEPFAVGKIRGGTISAGDWFRTSDQRVSGTVEAIEFVRYTDRESVALRIDVDVVPGDVLVGYEPTAA